MRLVLDTNVLISATAWEGEAHRLLQALVHANIPLFLSDYILKEFERVLGRDIGWTTAEIEEAVTSIKFITHVVKPRRIHHIIPADPADDNIIDCAVEAAASHIVSYDKHLLALNQYQGISIITPRQALSLLEKRN